MGDRVSVQFRTGEETSVALFSHWGGREFALEARAFAQLLLDERNGSVMPLDRFEPRTVMLNFVGALVRGRGGVVANDLYLGATPEDGDNSDNGNYVVEFDVERRVAILKKQEDVDR